MNLRDIRRCLRLVAVWLACSSLLSAEPASLPGPLRTCVLITGEQLHGEVLSAADDVIDFRWHGHSVRIPVAMVASIANPPGVADVVSQTLSANGPTEVAFEPVTNGFVQCEVAPHETDVTWQMQFGDDRVSIGVTTSGLMTATLPDGWSSDFRQPLRPQQRSLAMRFDDTTWDLRAGDALWQRGRKPAGALRRMTVSANGPGLLWARRFLPDRAAWPLPTLSNQDALLRIDGDVWYGAFQRLTSAGLEWRGPRNDTTIIPWIEFAAVQFRSRTNSSFPRVTGQVMQFVGPLAWEPWRLERERWLAVESEAGVEHPLLGSLPVQPGDYATLTQQPCRGWQWLHPQAVHLGDQIEPTYRQPLPQGTHLSGVIEFAELPAGPCAMSLDAVGLEPVGPATPATQPFLAALKAGGLRTELVINGTVVGHWNELLSHRPRSEQPARLRLSIPPAAWRRGRNDWLIRQHPAGDEFDDCELSRIALELP